MNNTNETVKKTDRRERKTTTLLKHSLIEMMKKQDFRKITVSSLASFADINRGTFYLHYLDIYDMLEKIESEIIDNLNLIVSKRQKDLLNNNYTSTIFEIANYVKKEKELFKAILGDNGDIVFMHRLKKEMMITFTNNCSKPFRSINNPDILKAAGSFIISGGIGIFQDWISQDCKYPAKELINELYAVFTMSR